MIIRESKKQITAIIAIFICFISYSGFSQNISGEIRLSPDWQSILYVTRVDDIGLHPAILLDSIQLGGDGHFNYSFKDYNSEGILYKITIPPVGGNYRTVIEGTQDNYFLFTTEGKESIEIKASADSLFYSAKINGGTLNRALLTFRDKKEHLFQITRLFDDSVSKYPSRKHELDSQLISYWFSFAEKFRDDIQNILDTTNNNTILLAGIYYLHQANFGIPDFDLLRKYIGKVNNRESILAKRIYQLAYDDDLARKGKLVPNLLFKDSSGTFVNLYDYTKKITVIDFWASWCGPCRKANRDDLPSFFERYVRGNDQIGFIYISIDEDESKWRIAIDQDTAAGNQLIDNDKSFRQLLSIDTIPLYVVLDHNHKVIFECISIYQLEDFLSRMHANIPKNK